MWLFFTIPPHGQPHSLWVKKNAKVTDISVVHYLLPNLRPNVSYKIATYTLYYAIHNNNKKKCLNGCALMYEVEQQL